jgi:hypothetical protein
MRVRPALTGTLLAAALTACGTPTVTDTADPGDTAAKEAAISAPSQSPAAEKKPGTAKIGNVITLSGANGAKIAVKLSRVIPTAKSTTEFITASDGNRFYGVELVLKNNGQNPYQDAPMNGAAIIDAEGQQFTPTIVDLQGGVPLNGSVTISPGDARKGIIGFEVPTDSRIVKLQFALDSGYADQKAEWLIRR